MAVAIYLRVSTEEQRERQSIETQREFAQRYCSLHSLSVFRVYADDGISGTVPLERRTEGSQILKDARAGKFTQLLIYRLDRLGRETRLILNAVDELESLRRPRAVDDRGVRYRECNWTARCSPCSPVSPRTSTPVIRERSMAGTQPAR